MYFLSSILLELYIGIMISTLFHYDENLKSRFLNFIKVPVIVNSFNVFSYVLYDFANHFEDSFNTVQYLLFSLILSIIVIIVDGFKTQKLFTMIEDCNKSTLSNKKTKYISLLIAFIGFLILTATDCSIRAFGATTIEQMIINMVGEKSGTSTEVIFDVVVKPIIYTLAFLVIFSIPVLSKYELKLKTKRGILNITTDKARRRTALALSILFVVYGLGHACYEFNIYKLHKIFFTDSTYLEDNYVNPKDVEIKFPENKRNLIHIYLESVESTYFSKELGGNMDDNLMPELAELTKEGIHFSNTDKFGGFQSSTGGQWSIASMINMYSGLPMKVPSGVKYFNDESSYMPKTIMLGDLLENEGYEQSVMFGSDIKFGGLNYLYSSHGNYNLLDLQYAIDNEWIPNNYHVWWGFEDDKLYEFAKTEITRLSQTGKPFNFTMETADTHFPDGYLSPNVKKEHESQYANVIKYSQAETVKFIRWIQEQPFYENTTIVITGDHLSMDATFFKKYVDKDYNRTVYNLILNPAENINAQDSNKFINRDFANFDLYPTILSSLGVEIPGQRLGIGTNLFSDKQTLFEKDGIEYVNNELEKHSDFYSNEIAITKD